MFTVFILIALALTHVGFVMPKIIFWSEFDMALVEGVVLGILFGYNLAQVRKQFEESEQEDERQRWVDKSHEALCRKISNAGQLVVSSSGHIRIVSPSRKDRTPTICSLPKSLHLLDCTEVGVVYTQSALEEVITTDFRDSLANAQTVISYVVEAGFFEIVGPLTLRRVI